MSGGFRIRVSGDQMAAYLCELVAGAAPSAADVLAVLADKKVTHGIDARRIDALLADCMAGALPAAEADDVATATGFDYRVARGEPAQAGTDGALQWRVDVAAEAASARVVRAGDPLAWLVPAGAGEPGFSVLGKRLNARPGQRVAVLPGPGVAVTLAEDGEHFASAWLGVAEFDGRVLSVDPRVRVSPDAMEAHMDVFARSADGATLDADAIAAGLAQQGVVAGIDSATIVSTLASAANAASGMVADVPVARGTAPAPGNDAHLVINHKDSVAGQLLSNGRIDFHERDYPWNVHAGEAIGYLIAAKPGVDGVSVRGDPLAAAPVKTLAVELDGLERDERGKLVAQRDGALIIDGLRLSVSELLVIQGDLDQSTGNVRSDQPVHVHGHVTAGYVLECSKDVIVERNIEDAALRAGGRVTIKGGVRGRESRIHSPRDISVAFVESAVLLANGDIHVATSAINSELSANGNVLVGSPGSARGTVMGGITRAQNTIDAAVLGAPSYVRTHLAVGHSSETRVQLEEIDGDLATCRSEVMQLQQLEQRLRAQTPDKLEALMPKIVATRTQALTRIAQRESEREILVAALKEQAGARVIVRQHCHPGVVVVIHEHRYEVSQEMGAGAFVFDGDAVVFTSG